MPDEENYPSSPEGSSHSRSDDPDGAGQRAALEGTATTALILEQDGRIGWSSESARDLFGADRVDPGKAIWDLVHPDDTSALKESLSAATPAGSSRMQQVRLILADGSAGSFDLSFAPGRDAKGRENFLLTFSAADQEGLHRQYSSESGALPSEDQLRAISDYGPDWENWFSAEGKLVRVNPAVEQITGYTPAECLEMTDFPRCLIVKDDRERLQLEFGGESRNHPASNIEFRVRRKDSSVVWVAASWQPLMAGNGTLVGFRSIIRDISRRKAAERELKENRRMLQTLLSNLPGMAYRCANTIDWPMEFVSEGCRALTGYEPEDLTSGRIPYGDLVHPEDRQRVWREVQEGVEGERAFQLEYRIIDREGVERWVWEQGRLTDEPGGEAALEGFITDITAKVEFHRALRRSEAQFRALVEQSLQGVVVLQGEEGRIVFANPPVAQVTGYSLAELLSSTLPRLLTEESAGLMERYRDRLRGENLPTHYEAPFRKADGSTLWADVASARTVFHGEPAVQIVLLDITARKQAETELIRRNEILKALGLVAEKLLQEPDLFQAIGLSVAILGDATAVDRICIHALDDKFSNLLRCHCIWSRDGLTPTEELGRDSGCDLRCDDPGMPGFLADLAGGRPMNGVAEMAPDALRGMLQNQGIRSLCVVPIFVHQEFWGFMALLCADVHRRWSEAELDALRAVAGTLGAAVERFETRRALQESEAHWRSLVRDLSNIVFTLDPEARLTFVNRPNIGRTIEDTVGRSVYDFIRPEERERAREKFGYVLRTGSTVSWEVAESPEFGGDFFNVTAGPIKSGERIIGVVGVMTDITEQKRAAERLLASERRFRQIIESSPMGIHLYRLEPNGRLVFEEANAAAGRILGIDHSELPGCTLEEAFPQLKGTEVAEHYRRAASDGTVWESEDVVYQDERVRGTFQVVAFQVSPRRMAVMFLDITERKAMQAALSESEERFRQAFRTSPDSITISRLEDGVYVDLNEGFTSITGYSRENALGQSSLALNLWVDLKARDYLVRELRGRGQVENLETEFRRKDGVTFAGLLSASLLALSGKPYILAVLRNIQELKETREALRREMIRAQNYLDVAATIMVAIDRQGCITLINRKGADLLGAPEDELVGLNWIEEFVPSEEREITRSELEKLLSGKREGLDYIESWVMTRTGDRRLVAWYSATIGGDGAGAPTSLLSSGIDITERRRMEDELQRTHEQLEQEHEELRKKNIALREVLSQIQEEKEGIKRQVLDNIESDILPTVQRLRAMGVKPQGALFDALEDGLGQISSDFASGLKEEFRNLTPRQLQICRLIKSGYTSKDIAESLGTSLLTIHKHREVIRDKLGLKNRNINLNTYLQSL